MFSQDELQKGHSFNFAPMIDFLFLMLALFATLAVSRAVLLDTEIELAELKPENTQSRKETPNAEKHAIHLSISEDGKYAWLTEFQKYPVENVESIQSELSRQYTLGILPNNKELTEVLLHIDKKAPWDLIANAIFAIREVGFSARPLYTDATSSAPKGN